MRSIRDMQQEFAKTQSIIEQIYAERRRQIDSEGWTPEHDDEHAVGELAMAAACYAMHSVYRDDAANVGDIPGYWPWDFDWWKPAAPRRDLIKAAALIVAEIERLDRALPPGDPEP